MGYLGYDPCALAVLLGAMDRALDERLTPSPMTTSAARRAVERATSGHRHHLAALAELAQVVGHVLRADPLGAYRTVALDPRELDRWVFHRGGRWRTALDPSPASPGWDRRRDVLNARLVAGWLSAERWEELLADEGDAAEPVVRYLRQLAADPAARAAFLDALGPARFGSMLATASTRFTGVHVHGAVDQPSALVARRAIDALGVVWAVTRARGERRTDAWDAAALGGPLFGASRLLGIAATTPGALSSAELARWGTTQWRRLSSDWDPAELNRPDLAGDQVLGALAGDGQAARRFLLELGAGPDLSDLAALVANSFSSPPVSGALLLASTDPSTLRTASAREEVRRSVHAVLTVVDHLLAERLARAPAVDRDGRLTGPPGATLPTGLGLYTGRQLVHLIDRCDGAPDGCTPLGRTWPGWENREVAGLLARLVVDERTAAELQEAALAGWLARIARTDLAAPGATDAVRRETFAVGALDGIVGDQSWERNRMDHERFQAQVAGLDLAVDVVGIGLGRVPRAVAAAWDPVSDAGAAVGPGSLGELALGMLRPERPGDVRARTEASQTLTTARLKGAVAAVMTIQAGGSAARTAPGADPLAPDPEAAARSGTARAGDNANAAAYLQLAASETAAPDATTRERIDHLQAVVGDAMTEGRAWVG